MNENEVFNFPDYQLNRQQFYNNAGNRHTEEYVQASISNRGKNIFGCFEVVWHGMT